MFATASRRLPMDDSVVPTTHHRPGNTATSWIALFRDGIRSSNDDINNNNDPTAVLSLQIHALQQLLQILSLEHQSHEWSLMVTILPDLEALAEDESVVVGDSRRSTTTTTTTNPTTTNHPRQQLSQLAAAIASQVFFYLEEPNAALRLALLAGPYSPLTTTTSRSPATALNDPYVTTLVRAALDAYIQTRQQEWETTLSPSGTPSVSTTMIPTATESSLLLQWNTGQLQPMIDTIIESAMATGEVSQYRYAIGICYDARDIPKLQYVLQHAIQQLYENHNNNDIRPIRSLLQYTMQCVMDHTIMVQQNDRTLSQLALTTIAALWQQLLYTDSGGSSSSGSSGSNTNTARMEDRMTIVYDLVRTYHALNEPLPVALALQQLLLSAHDVVSVVVSNSTTTTTTTTTPQQQQQQHLTALQIAFDLVDTGDQTFCQQVAETLRNGRPAPTEDTIATETAARTTTTAAATAAVEALPDIWDHILHVLVGGFVSELILSFRHRHSQADPKIMETLKKNLEDRSSGSNRNSSLHTTAITTHAYLYAGTTNDTFLRNHLDWMKKASHWAKFTATASLGVIHADHVTEAMQLLEPYLPTDPDDGGSVSATGGYAEGGSLYALGLIHGSSGMTNAEKRRDAATFVRKHLRASHVNDAISHGACLAVGLTCFGSADPRVVHELKDVLDTDFAVAGEAAGLAIGMVLVGTGAGNIQNRLPDSSRDELMDIVSELKNYARETQHEKIIRGIAMGIAIMNFGQEDNADTTIEEMRTDRDPIMRYGAQYAIALAYCGTGSNKAIRILLHTAVSDVSDDVRMAAVIGLAFVLFKTPERVPQLVKLLLESFNPHVRYASCMAVGIAMAGTGDSESIALLEPMLDDMTDYVRQGALIGTAMIYMQQSDTSNGRKIRSFREKLSTLVSEKHQSTLTKMGAIMSIGIMDAGGRNCALQLGSRTGFTKMTSAVGLALWLQHWHWFPMMHMFSLALTPTLTIGLNKDLKYPKTFEIICNSKPSQFAFPKKVQEKKEKVKKHVETFTLSTTAKEKARLARKKAKEEKETMDEGDEAKNPAEESEEKSGDAMEVEKEADEEVDEEEKPRKKREPEPLSFSISNPARVTKAQSPFCSFDVNQRYRPIRADESPYGVIMLQDCTPDEEEYIGTVKSPSLEPLGELAPPEPFVWIAPPLPEEPEEKNDNAEEDMDVKETSE